MSQTNPNSPAEQLDPNTRTLARGAGINVTGIAARSVLYYAYGIVIARIAGTAIYGTYSIALALHTLMLLLGEMGLKQAVVRYVSEYHAQNRPAYVKAMLLRALQLGAAASLTLTVALWFAAGALASLYEDPHLATVLRLFALALPIAVSNEIFSAFTHGFQAMRYTFYVQNLMRPLLELAFGAGLLLLGFDAPGLALAYLLAATAGAVVLFVSANRLAKLNWRPLGATVHIPVRPILAFATPVMVTALLQVAMRRSTVLIIGALRDNASAGIMNAVTQTAYLTALFLASFGLIIAPIAAALYQARQMRDLKKLFVVTTRWILTLSLPVFILLAYLSKPVLAAFGPEFTVAAPAMVILIAGQFVNVSVGAGGVIINMSDRPRLNMFNTLVAFAGNVGLSFWLIPRLAFTGAAIALGAMLALINVLQVVQIRLILGIHPYSPATLKPLAAGFTGVVAGALAHLLLITTSPVARYAVVCAVFGGVYLATLILLKFDPEDLALLRTLQRRLTGQSGRYRRP